MLRCCQQPGDRPDQPAVTHHAVAWYVRRIPVPKMAIERRSPMPDPVADVIGDYGAFVAQQTERLLNPLPR